ncbi:MAG: GNAT family N-acetyltransferase [Mycetocola sp.]
MQRPFTISRDDWDGVDGSRLRAAQRAELDARYGSSTHEYGAAPSADTITVFVVARTEQGEAVACGGLRPLGDGDIELKRMFVDPASRGSGVATLVLRALEREAIAEGATRMLLEAGDLQPEAIRFYTREGYTRIDRFGAYIDDPHSVCFERVLRD